MKNTTVKELIEMLSSVDQNAIVCRMEFEDEEPVYSTFEMFKEFKGIDYIRDDGNIETGNIVALY